MCNLRCLIPFVVLCSLLPSVSSAAIITLNMTNAAGGAGEAFALGNTFVDSGVTFSVSTSTTLGAPTTSEYSATSTAGGVNSTGTGAGDAPSEIDLGETLTISLTFGPTTTVSLENINLRGVGGNNGMGASSGDAAFVTTPSGPVTLFTGVADFNGTQDIWTPTGGISLASGNNIVITAENVISIDAISFDAVTTAIPEPSSFGILGVLGIGILVRQRRARRRS